MGRAWEKQSNPFSLMAPRCFLLCQCHLSWAPGKEPPQSLRAPISWARPGFACDSQKAFPWDASRAWPPFRLSAQSHAAVGSPVGMGRTRLGALRLAPANTFRKYGFLVNRVKKENSLTNLPRVKVSPGECAPHCQHWLCQGRYSRCIFPHPLLTSHLLQGAFETSLSQIALGKITTIIITVT